MVVLTRLVREEPPPAVLGMLNLAGVPEPMALLPKGEVEAEVPVLLVTELLELLVAAQAAMAVLDQAVLLAAQVMPQVAGVMVPMVLVPKEEAAAVEAHQI